MEMKTFYVPAKDCELYCEQRGSGPLMIIMPDGSNDAGVYSAFAELMADEFTVVAFDPRGGSRSLPAVDVHVTPEILAEDIAAIIRFMDMGKASVYGCSSGGQAVLMTGVMYPELIKNIMIHEAALQMDTPLPGAGFEFIKTFTEVYAPHIEGVPPFNVACSISFYPPEAYDAETNARLDKNSAYWGQWYLGTIDSHSYSAEELAKIPACDFTVGAWTPAWLPYANIATAERGGFDWSWLPCSHAPHMTCPDLLAAHCHKAIHKYN